MEKYYCGYKGEELTDNTGKRMKFDSKEEAKQELKRRGLKVKDWGIYKIRYHR